MTKKVINPEDSDLFRNAIGNVQKIKNDTVPLKKPIVPKPYPKLKPTHSHDEWQRKIAPEPAKVEHEETLSFTAPGVQKSVLIKLRKGTFNVQASIDLHGQTTDSAKQQFLRFLEASFTSGYSCIHIIHGKGYRSSESQPVLKNSINRWLREHKNVKAFCSTPQKYGGAGAVWVLLTSQNAGRAIED